MEDEIIEEIFSQHFKIQDDYTEENIKDAIANTMQRTKDGMKKLLPSESEIMSEAFNVVTPYGRQAVVNDRKQYFIKGAEYVKSKIAPHP